MVSYIGTQNAFPFIMSGLEKLAYRWWYDAAGSALCGDQLIIHKAAVKVGEIRVEPVDSCTGIAYNVSREPVHLYLAGGTALAIVTPPHGIIELYQALKRRPIEAGTPGITFVSAEHRNVVAR
ncbi:MAG: hypothetical protein ACP5E9_03010 [Candidatus Methanospirareceae archaeon]